MSLKELMRRFGGAGRTRQIEDVPETRIGMIFNDIVQYQLTEFLKDRADAKCNVFTTAFTLGSKCKEFALYLEDGFIVSQLNASGFAVSEDPNVFLTFEENRDALRVNLHGEKEVIAEIEKNLKSEFPASSCFIDWVYDPQYLESISLNLNTENIPVDEMYPFLNGETLHDYYDRFVKSTANILVLIGPPGTGKTTWLKGLLAHTQKSATLTYNRKIIEQDGFFVEWYNSKNDFLILEDSDTLLLPREDGNDLMARFLNVGDGLMSIKNKKIIFSTNLPNIGDIDPALVRPGRCFDILEFGSLNRDQAEVLCDKMNLPLPEGNKMTLAEIFASTKNEIKHQPKSKFGFI